jgi:hypothetical protein
MKTTSIEQLNITRRDAMKGSVGAASLAALGTGAAIPVAISTASVTISTDTAQAQPSPALPQGTDLRKGGPPQRRRQIRSF